MKSFVKACVLSAFLTVFVLPAVGKELIRWSDIENAYDGSFGVPISTSSARTGVPDWRRCRNRVFCFSRSTVLLCWFGDAYEYVEAAFTARHTTPPVHVANGRRTRTRRGDPRLPGVRLRQPRQWQRVMLNGGDRVAGMAAAAQPWT